MYLESVITHVVGAGWNIIRRTVRKMGADIEKDFHHHRKGLPPYVKYMVNTLARSGTARGRTVVSK
jgi:hypothetical protein